MAVPDTPLRLSIDTEALTLGEIALFQGDFNAPDFIAFLADHGNWTKAEIKRITVRELRQVAGQIGEALKESAIPKAS